MQHIEVHSTKYDGSLHYRFPTRIVRQEPGLLAVHMALDTPLASYRGPVINKYHSLILYWTDRHYSLIVDWRPDGEPYRHYVNIQTPADWSDGTIRFIDLDLDVMWFADGRVVLDDEEEFETHRAAWRYPDALVRTALLTVAQVRSQIATLEFPFDGSLFRQFPAG